MTLMLLLPLYLLLPTFSIRLCQKYKVLKSVGPIIICYGLGIIIGFVLDQFNLTTAGLRAVQEEVLNVLVALSLPMLLFSTDVRGWFGQAGKAALAMILALLCVSLVATLAAYPLLSNVENLWQISGMAVGAFTGSTPNVAAVKTATEASSDTFLLVHGYDVITSMLYLLLVMTAAHRLAKLVLPAFAGRKGNDDEADHNEHLDQYQKLLSLSSVKKILPALGLTLVIVGCSVAASKLVPENYGTMVVILLLTLGGMAATFSDRVRNIPNTYHLGMYLIMIFCTAAGSLLTVDVFAQISATLMFYFLVMVFGSMALHLILCRFFKIDADTFLITSVASICSPPFVPVAAAVMNNQKVLLSGLSAGVIGYAAGNLLGIGVAFTVKAMTG